MTTNAGKAPTAEDVSKLESRYQKEISTLKADLKTERETNGARLSQLEDDLEAAQGSGGDEEVATARKKLRADQRKFDVDRKAFDEQSNSLSGQALEIAIGKAHTSLDIPLSLFEGAESLDQVELIVNTFKAVKGSDGSVTPKGDDEPPDGDKTDDPPAPGYERGAGTRNQKSFGDIAVNGSSEDFAKASAEIKRQANEKVIAS
jgi:hypothetical protein